MKQPDEGNLFTDLMEIGPAPIMAREIVVMVITAALLVVVLALFGPGIPIAVASAVAVAFFAARFVIGKRHWEKAS